MEKKGVGSDGKTGLVIVGIGRIKVLEEFDRVMEMYTKGCPTRFGWLLSLERFDTV